MGEEGWRERCAGLDLPLWVKPSRLGSSVGISRVESLDALDAAVEEARRHDPRVIVEAPAEGREVECSLLGNDDVEVSPPGSSRCTASGTTTSASTARAGWSLSIPAPIPAEQQERVRELALAAFRLGGCSGLARCDFFVEPDGRVLVNEVNTMPGFTETSVYAKLWEAAGLAYPDLCRRLVELAIERHESARSYEF